MTPTTPPFRMLIDGRLVDDAPPLPVPERDLTSAARIA